MATLEQGPTILLDFNAVVIHSLWFGKDPDALEDSAGKPLNTAGWAVEKFVNHYLFPILQWAQPRQILAVLDGSPVRRIKYFPDYKRRRLEKAPDPLVEEQVARAKALVRSLLLALGAGDLRIPTVEADDLIAYLVHQLPGPKSIFTTDADLLQLAGEDTLIFMKGVVYDRPDYEGTPLALVALHKALRGDASDGYVGVRGFGPAAYAQLVADIGWDGMQELDQHLRDNNPQPLQAFLAGNTCPPLKYLVERWDEMFTSYELARLHPEWCVGVYDKKPVTLASSRRVPSQSQLVQTLRAAGREFLWDELKKYCPRQGLLDARKIEARGGLEAVLARFREMAADSPCVTFDFETYDRLRHPAFQDAKDGYVDMQHQVLTGCSICFGANHQHVIYLPVEHKDTDNVLSQTVRAFLAAVPEDVPLVAQNAPFEITVCMNTWEWAPPRIHDTRILAHHVDENLPTGLKDLSKRYLRYEQITYEQVMGDRQGMNELSGREVLRYGCDDALTTAWLYEEFWLRTQLEGTWQFIADYEFDFAYPVVEGYRAGVHIDWARLAAYHQADEAAFKAHLKVLNETLAAHCATPPQTGVQRIWEEFIPVTQARLAASDKPPPEIEQRVGEEREKLRALCAFRLPEVLKVDPETIDFLPTSRYIDAVCEKLGLPPPPTLAPTKLPVVYFSRHPEIFHHPDPQNPQTRFMHLLAAASTDLHAQGRRSPEYRAFEAFCRQALVQGQTFTVGTELNVGSPLQMACVLYGMMDLPVRLRNLPATGSLRDRNKLSGAPSTDALAVATALAEDIQDADDWRRPALLAFKAMRLIETRISNTFKPYPLWRHPTEGVIRPSIQNCGTVTRRPSASSPNILAVSKHKDDGKTREVFITPGPDWLIIASDWNQQELRIIAAESQDANMMSAYIGTPRRDIHTLTAHAIAASVLRGRIAPELMEQLQELSYDEFVAVLKNEKDPLHDAIKAVRKKEAKSCIAAGSLVLTDYGLVPIERVTTRHRVWDGVEWVTHDGIVFQGYREVISYAGLTATPDHIVYLEDGSAFQFGEISNQQKGCRLAVGEAAGCAVRWDGANIPRILGAMGSENSNTLSPLWADKISMGTEPVTAFRGTLLMQQEAEIHRPAWASVIHPLQRALSTVYQSTVALLAELRRAWDTVPVQFTGSVCTVGIGEFTSRNVSGSRYRPHRQPGSLRTRQSATGYSCGKSEKQADKSEGGIQGARSAPESRLAPHQDRLSGVSIHQQNNTATNQGRVFTGQYPISSPCLRGWAPVYDIVNAGPRHRFTVSGVIVSNCNFLLSYLGTAPTLAAQLIVTKETAQEWIDQTLATYPGMKRWQDGVIGFAQKHGYTRTAYGSRRHLNARLFDEDGSVRRRLERQAVNYTVQGCAADILKTVMSAAHRSGVFEDTGALLIAPIYDEILCAVPKRMALEYIRRMQELMDFYPPGHPVPQVSEHSIGPSWGELVELGSEFTDDDFNAAVAAIEKNREAA